MCVKNVVINSNKRPKTANLLMNGIFQIDFDFCQFDINYLCLCLVLH